ASSAPRSSPRCVRTKAMTYCPSPASPPRSYATSHPPPTSSPASSPKPKPRWSLPESSRRPDRRLEDEGHEHLGRAPVHRVVVWELLGHVALLDRRAVEEVDTGQHHGGQPQPAQRHRRAGTRDQDARVDRVAD